MSRKKPRKQESRQDKKQHFNRQREQKAAPPPLTFDLQPIAPKTGGQEALIDAIQSKEITICDGPAGTGKSFISFGSALHYRLTDYNIKRIIIVRPTIASGNDSDLGFLPGDLNEKMMPFIAPLVKDALPLLIDRHDTDTESYNEFVNQFITQLNIEVVPLAYMRGRTFNNAFVILDEAQNCTMTDFKLFLTRIGMKSKTIIEGDSTQSDIPDSGFLDLQDRLEGLKPVSIVKLGARDIVRNPILASIIERLDG